MTARASVVIVTYNSAGVIDECLSFLASASPGDLDVVVIDNASTDDTLERLARWDQVHVVRNTENVGFARAVNRAVRVAVPPGRPIVILNPDAVIQADALGGLVGSLASAPGIVAPSITQPQGRLRISSAGRSPTTWRMFTHFSGLSILPGAVWEGHYLRSSRVRSDRAVDWATGACLAISREAWDAVGGFTERWFMYAEDVHLCEHVRAAGYQVTIRPSLTATHLVGHSSESESRINSSWIVNLYDYFCGELATGRFDQLAWKLVATVGLWSRSALFSIESIRRPYRRRDALRFSTYARDLWRTPPSASRTKQ